MQTIEEKISEIIDNIVIEWCYRLPDGIPDLNDPKKLRVLYEVIHALGYANLLKEEKIVNDSSVYVFYVDYFQPFTIGHYQNYKKLISKFKNVAGDSFYFVTDDKMEKQKPFDFESKKKIMNFFGISDKKIIKVSDLTNVTLFIDAVVRDKSQAAAIVAIDDINAFSFKNGEKKEYASVLRELDPISEKNVFYFYKMKNSLNSLALVMGLLDSKKETERRYFFSKYFGSHVPYYFFDKILKQIKLQSLAQDIAAKKIETKASSKPQSDEQRADSSQNDGMNASDSGFDAETMPSNQETIDQQALSQDQMTNQGTLSQSPEPETTEPQEELPAEETEEEESQPSPKKERRK